MNIIQHKSYGPVAALKKTFRKQILLMAMVPFLFLITGMDNIDAVLSSIMFWCYVAFCIGLIFFAWHNYQIVKKMEGMDGVVKENLQQQIQLLEKRARWEIGGLRIVLLFFIILTEVVPYFQHYRILDRWHSLSPFIRYATYGVLIAAQYFLFKKIKQRKVGRHLVYLKELVKEMD